LYIGEILAMEFGGKASEHDLIESMKDKFKLTKKMCGYSITSITNPPIRVTS